MIARTGDLLRIRKMTAEFAAVALLGILLMTIASSPAAGAGPSLVILSPANDQVIGNGTPVVVNFAVSNFTLVQPGRVGQVVSPTEGHLDVYVDGMYAQLITRPVPISLTLVSGVHTIRLQLVASDGSPLVPDVFASVRVVASQGPAAGTPSIRIVSPAPGQLTGHDVYFAVRVTNFTLVDAVGQPNAPNEGHVQFLVEGAFQQEPRAYQDAFIVDMHDGNNTVIARLVNNDNTPLTPDVSASVTIRVKTAPDPIGSELATAAISLILASILIVLILRRRSAAARVAPPKKDS
jgi:methionine-rich copper-binding protein CopC